MYSFSSEQIGTPQRRPASEQYPIAIHRNQVVTAGVVKGGIEPHLLSNALKNWPEIKVSIRHVRRNDAITSKFIQIDLERLLREEMDRDCISTEGVQHEQVKFLGGVLA